MRKLELSLFKGEERWHRTEDRMREKVENKTEDRKVQICTQRDKHSECQLDTQDKKEMLDGRVNTKAERFK